MLGIHKGQKRVLDSLELDLQAVVSHLVSVPGSWKNILNHWAISLAWKAFVAWIIKTQRQILEFKLKIRKAKWLLSQPQIEMGDSAYMNTQTDCDSEHELCHLHFIYLSSAGIKGVYHHLTASVTN